MAKRLVCVLGGLSVSVAAIFPVVNRPKSLRSGDETERRKLKINEAIKQSRKLINRLKNEVGAPGIVVGVSVDGEQVWKEGIGYADLENEVETHEDTVMRIASISKSLTAAVVARLWQDGVIDIDKPVQSYVPTFPEKIFGKKKVTISTRQLMCHLSGIRHYSTKKKEESDGSGDGQFDEFYSKDRYDSVEKALAIFKDDDLLFEPGSKFLYTTYGWTLVSAVMEGATGKTYPQIMRAFLRELGMRRTYLDQPEPIIYGRSKSYSKNKNGRVVNSPYVDNSCKWAGGGFLSTVGDLLTFSNALLFAFQRDGDIEMNREKYHYSVTTDKKSESVSQEVSSDLGPGVSSITSRVVSESNITTSKKKESVSKEVSSDLGSEVGIIHSGVVPVANSTIAKKSESGSLVVTKGIASGVDNIASGACSTSVKKNESGSKEVTPKLGSRVDRISSGVVSEANSTTVKKSESGSKEVTSDLGTKVSSITSGVVSGASSVWKYGSSLIKGDQSDSSEKDNKDNEFDDSSTAIEKSESILEEVKSGFGSGVGSITSGVVSGTSSVWKYGSSLIKGDQSDSSEKDNKDNEFDDSSTAIEKSESILEEVKSGFGSGVGSITSGVVSGASSVWKYGSSWLWSSEKEKRKEKSESGSKEVKSGFGSGVDSITSGVVSGASSVWKYGSSWLWSSEKDKERENGSGKSILSSLSNLFKPKALDNNEVPVITNEKHKEVSSFPVTNLTDKLFWNDIVIPYAICAVKGKLSERVASHSDEEDYENFNGIDSPFFSKRLNREPYILPSTVAELWTRVDGTILKDWGPHVEGGYGLGFGVASPIDSPGGVIDGGQPYIVGHTGGAVGASSAMIIVPRKCNKEEPPKGIAVVLMCNLQSVSLNPLAIEIAKIFSLV